MEITLVPINKYDVNSKRTIHEMVKIAKGILDEWKIPMPDRLEFYNDLGLFINRVLPQVKNYGLTKKQSEEFIKATLNYSSYGTFDIKKNTIIEMNYNPYFKHFYPSIQFLKLIIHESLHLFLYSKLPKDIYLYKYKFFKGEYIGEGKIIQLDEGFATILTEKIMKDIRYSSIRKLPIFSSVTSPPLYKEKIRDFDIKEFNEKFNKIYDANTKKGKKILGKKYLEIRNNDRVDIVKELIAFIQKEISQII